MSKPKNSKEFRQQIANEFVNLLEEQQLNWKKEWKGIGRQPQNGVTHAFYNGCNRFNLAMTAMIHQYEDPRWVTMVQIMDKKGTYHPNQKWHLKAGSKAIYVEYWFPYNVKEKQALTWDQYSIEIKNGSNPDSYTLLTRYTPVFNADLVEGIPEFELPIGNRDVNVDDLVNTLSQNMKVGIQNDGGDRSYYSPVEDEIHLPKPEAFFSSYAYNTTALHELAHATGHYSRLNRQIENFFGSEPYAYEELVAEISSCFMSVNLDNELSPQHMENHKAYVQSWVRGIKQDPNALIHAIKDAQIAAAYMEYKAFIISFDEYKKVNEAAIEIPEECLQSPEEAIDCIKSQNTYFQKSTIMSENDLDTVTYETEEYLEL